MCNKRVPQLVEATSAEGHPWGDIPHHNLEVDESEENEGKEEGGYINEDGRLTRVLALRVPVDTRWNYSSYMIKR